MPNILLTENNTCLSWENLIYIADLLEFSNEKKLSLLNGKHTLHPDFIHFFLYLQQRKFSVNFTNKAEFDFTISPDMQVMGCLPHYKKVKKSLYDFDTVDEIRKFFSINSKQCEVNEKKENTIFFLDSTKKENYDAVQILSSLGIYSGIVINENADWERLTDLMYYALYGRVTHAPIEPFQYVFDMYDRNRVVDYEVCGERYEVGSMRERERFFYEATDCAACEGWRICLGKYEKLEDKTGCQSFMTEWLNVVENLKFVIRNL
jgi:hypothetical protein